MSPSVPNPPTPSHLFRVKAKVLNAPKAPLHLPMRLISLTSSPLTHSQPCWPPRSHTRAHTHTHAWWPPRLLFPPPGMLFFRSPLGSVPHHLQISTQMSPPQQGPSPPAHFKYHPLPQLSQFLSSSSIYHKTLYTHTHTHTHTHIHIFFWLCCATWDPSSPTRDRTHSPCIGNSSLNHWTAREVPVHRTQHCWLDHVFSMFTAWLLSLALTRAGTPGLAHAQPHP